MKLVIFGLTISSSWGNGHATLWRGLVRALARDGHEVAFFERDVEYYASHRDLCALEQGELILYADWSTVAERARRAVSDCDTVIVTSYCPDARAVTQLVLGRPRRPVTVFYDLDTPVTLARLKTGSEVPYLPANGLSDFDLVLSYTGGRALGELQDRLGARRVAPLYGHADPETHFPCAPASDRPLADLSYLGTYAPDRQPALARLFIEPAAQRPGRRFVLGGSGYPHDFPWRPNIWFLQHVPPPSHPAFFCTSRLTLNVTRADMAAMGYCPSGRLFEAAACGVLVLSDAWEGLDQFYSPGSEILVARDTADVLDALDRSGAELAAMASRARERTLDEHTSAHRARELLALLSSPASAVTRGGTADVGHHSGRRQRHAHSTARVLEGAASGRRA